MALLKRSLSVDQNDGRALRDIDHEALSSDGQSPVGLAVPFFFTRETATLPLVGAFRNSAAFLIGGGPSLRELDLTKIAGTWRMTLNNGPTTIRPNANCTVDEPGRFNFSTWIDPTIMKFVPMGQFEKPLWDNRRVKVDGEWVQKYEPSKLRVGDCPNVIGYRRNEKFHAPRYLYEETINWGNHAKHGGGRSVMLAALRILFLLGFRRVYLLGVDFEMTAEKKYHFAEDRTPGSIRGNMHTYAKMRRWFKELQPYFLREKFIVKNCNPHSRLQAFPYMPYDAAVEEAMGHLGDYRNERTTGMYRKKDEKLAEIGQVLPGVTIKTSGASSASASAIGSQGGNLIVAKQGYDTVRAAKETSHLPVVLTRTVQRTMRVEIVTHCYHYSRLLRYQLSSLVLWPPQGVEITSTVCFTTEDRETAAVLEWCGAIAVEGVSWNWMPLESRSICRRSIGRNRAALATEADWVWFCDADYWFRAECWKTFLRYRTLQDVLIFPRFVLGQRSHAMGDSCIARATDAKNLVEANPNEFAPERMRRAIGGMQIVRGDVCRTRGYLKDSKEYQRPPRTLEFQRTREDPVFRKSLGTCGIAVDLPEVYRIRHSVAGRHDPTARL